MRAVSLLVMLAVPLLVGCTHRTKPLVPPPPAKRKPDYVVPAKCIQELWVFPGSRCEEQKDGTILCQYIKVRVACVAPAK